MKKVIVFDFDGVVCDSTDECMVTAWNSWQKFCNKEDYRRDVNDFVDTDKELFRLLRPYVKGAGEYYLVWRAMTENIIISNQKDYERLQHKWHDNLNKFKEIFYQQRDHLRNKDIDHWISLHNVYPEVIIILKKLISENRLYVATLKDKDSVHLIFNHNNIFLEKNRIIDQSEIDNKTVALEMIAEKEKIKKDELIFIDDNVMHLMEPFQAGYRCYLTGWGNILPEYKKLAIKQGIKILELSDLDKTLL